MRFILALMLIYFMAYVNAGQEYHECSYITDPNQCEENPNCSALTYKTCCGKIVDYCVRNTGNCDETHLRCLQKDGIIAEFWSSCLPYGWNNFTPNNTNCDQNECESRGGFCEWITPPCSQTQCCPTYARCSAGSTGGSSGSSGSSSGGDNCYTHKCPPYHTCQMFNGKPTCIYQGLTTGSSSSGSSGSSTGDGCSNTHCPDGYYCQIQNGRPVCFPGNRPTHSPRPPKDECEINWDKHNCLACGKGCKWLRFKDCCGEEKGFCVKPSHHDCRDKNPTCAKDEDTGKIYDVWSCCKPNSLVEFVPKNVTCRDLHCEKQGKICSWWDGHHDDRHCISRCCPKSARCVSSSTTASTTATTTCSTTASTTATTTASTSLRPTTSHHTSHHTSRHSTHHHSSSGTNLPTSGSRTIAAATHGTTVYYGEEFDIFSEEEF